MAESAAKQHSIAVDFAAEASDLTALSAEELALRSKKGCEASFAELVDRYGVRLNRFLCRRIARTHDAEDLVQETFARAYTNIHRYDPAWRFSTWLFTIARRLAVSHYRTSCRRDNLPEPAEHHTPQPPEILAARQTRRDLWQIAEQLPENQYHALWLKYAESMSIKQIATVLKKSNINVKVLLYRARTNLGRRIEESPRHAEIVEMTPKTATHKITKLEGVK